MLLICAYIKAKEVYLLARTYCEALRKFMSSVSPSEWLSLRVPTQLLFPSNISSNNNTKYQDRISRLYRCPPAISSIRFKLPPCILLATCTIIYTVYRIIGSKDKNKKISARYKELQYCHSEGELSFFLSFFLILIASFKRTLKAMFILVRRTYNSRLSSILFV